MAKKVNRSRKIIGLIVPAHKRLYNSFFFSEIMKGITKEAAHYQFDLLLHIIDLADTKNLFSSEVFNTKQVEGIIFADINSDPELLTRILGEKRMPVVVMNNFIDDLPVNCIGIDNEGGAKKAVDYLVGLGHNKIATITGDLVVQAGRSRLDGYVRSLNTKGIALNEEYIQKGDFSLASARNAMKRLLKIKPRPTAIFAASDEMALEAIKEVEAEGLRVPRDISVIGFDDNTDITPVYPLTTVHQPLMRMGEMAIVEFAQMLRKKKAKPLKMLLATEIVERESCKKKGFTLVELMLVIIIIGVLAGAVLPRLQNRAQQARAARAKADIEANIATALDLYELDNGAYPTTDQGLTALLTKPHPDPLNWNGPYLKKKPIDSWRNEYLYEYPAKHGVDYDLYSHGPDGTEGGGDDIVNWETEE